MAEATKATSRVVNPMNAIGISPRTLAFTRRQGNESDSSYYNRAIDNRAEDLFDRYVRQPNGIVNYRNYRRLEAAVSRISRHAR